MYMHADYILTTHSKLTMNRCINSMSCECTFLNKDY